MTTTRKDSAAPGQPASVDGEQAIAFSHLETVHPAPVDSTTIAPTTTPFLT